MPDTDTNFVSPKNIPLALKQRGGFEKKNLFIRSCYVDIYDEIISNYLTNVIRQPNFIGKSGFFLYFLLRYI
jgi:hypothetical protein